MSISEKILRTADSKTELPDKLNAIAGLLQEECGMSINFCRIFGKRWSYVAGDRQLEFVSLRRQLNPEYGIFYAQNNQIDDKTMQEILDILNQILTEPSNVQYPVEITECPEIK